MQTIMVYRYERPDGGITVSPVMPRDGTTYDLRYRLIADEGKALTDGRMITSCVDVTSPDGWTEIEAPEVEPELTETEQKAAAYDILTGGAE